MRTKRFMEGVYTAVKEKMAIIGNRPVCVLYAGTGPFATLVLPLLTRFSENQVQFILLEVNESAMQSLQHLVISLKLEKYILSMERADATQWKLPPASNVDVFICETMQQGLKNEPQVAICHHILPQLPQHTILIPQKVVLKAAMIDHSKIMSAKLEGGSFDEGILVLDTVFILDKESILYNRVTDNEGIFFPETRVSIPDHFIKTHPELYLLTEITVYKEEELLFDECALTIPLFLSLLQPLQNQIAFRYITGKKPGLSYHLLPDKH